MKSNLSGRKRSSLWFSSFTTVKVFFKKTHPCVITWIWFYAGICCMFRFHLNYRRFGVKMSLSYKRSANNNFSLCRLKFIVLHLTNSASILTRVFYISESCYSEVEAYRHKRKDKKEKAILRTFCSRLAQNNLLKSK